MPKSIVMFTGVPGSGKTTLMEEVVRKMQSEKLKVALVSEYDDVSAWAKQPENRENEALVRIIGESFDFSPAAYQPMSEYVAGRLGEKIARLFSESAAVVVFEAARGVGEPRVDYASFVESFTKALGEQKDQITLANIEVVADYRDIAERMRLRYEADPSAPPPGIEWKYLGKDGTPLSFATRDLAEINLNIPLVFNEVIRNGKDRESLREEMESELYPRLVASLGLPPADVEGRSGGFERLRF